MFAVVRVLAIVVLAATLGAGALYFDFFPGRFFRDAFVALDAVIEQQKQLGSPVNGTGITMLDAERSGVVRHVEDATADGYTLVSLTSGDTVKLLDMRGRAVHEWRVNYADIWEPSEEITQLVPERFIFIRKARMYPDGRLLLIFSAWATTPYGYGIAMVDRDSRLLWKDCRAIHHSFDQAADGTIYALHHEVRSGEDGPYLDDGVLLYGADGELQERFSLFDAFADSRFAEVLEELPDSGADGVGNLLHSNDIEVLDAPRAGSFPFAEQGDLLVSFREIDGIAVVDPGTRRVKWFRKGYWHKQHDPDFLSNGNILLFDNVYVNSGERDIPVSRVLEFDPQTMEIVWQYTDTEGEVFFSAARGSQQRLANGNTLITESGGGRIFEVTRAGEVVWEYFTPVRINTALHIAPMTLWAWRYRPDQARFLQDAAAADPAAG